MSFLICKNSRYALTIFCFWEIPNLIPGIALLRSPFYSSCYDKRHIVLNWVSLTTEQLIFWLIINHVTIVEKGHYKRTVDCSQSRTRKNVIEFMNNSNALIVFIYIFINIMFECKLFIKIYPWMFLRWYLLNGRILK